MTGGWPVWYPSTERVVRRIQGNQSCQPDSSAREGYGTGESAITMYKASRGSGMNLGKAGPASPT